MYKYELGNRSEAIVLGAYLDAGFTVSVPFGMGASYDLIVDTGTCLFKIQVKTAWIQKDCVIYKSLRRQPGTGLTRRPYEIGEVDYFAVYCPANKTLYAVPSENHGTHGRLRINPVKNGQAKFIRWAVDFTWERHVEEVRNKCAWQESNLRPPV
ncbi:MAG: group I intron-associated PD-(D/E)XK endonuclease, partial [Pyrinomonadaceae bacterium]